MKQILHRVIPLGIIGMGVIIAIFIFFLDFLRGGLAFGKFGAIIFMLGIYISITGFLLFFLPEITSIFMNFLNIVLKNSKLLILIVGGYILVLLVLYAFGRPPLFIIQIPVFPVYIIGVMCDFFSPGPISITLKYGIGIPLASVFWFLLIRYCFKKIVQDRKFRELEETHMVSSRVIDRKEGDGFIGKHFHTIFILTLFCTFLARFLLSLNSIPGDDTPYYLSWVKVYIQTGSISDLLHGSDFYSAIPVALFSFLCGGNQGLILQILPFYASTISLATNLLFMLCIYKITRNKKATILVGFIYAFFPTYLVQSYGTFKYNFALLCFFISLFLYLYLFLERKKEKLVRYMGLAGAFLFFLLSVLYFFFLLLLGICVLVFFLLPTWTKKKILIFIFLSSTVTLGVIISFNFFQDVAIIESIYDFIYFSLFLNDTAPIPIYQLDFFLRYGILVFFVPFIIFGVFRLYKIERGEKWKKWRLSMVFVMILMIISFFPLFGGLFEAERAFTTSIFFLISFIPFGIQYIQEIISKRLYSLKFNGIKKSISNLILRKNFLYLVFVGFFLGSYFISYNSLSSGTVTKLEHEGLKFLEDSVDLSIFSNQNLSDSTILPNKHLKKWVHYYFSPYSTNYPITHENLLYSKKVNNTSGYVEEIMRNATQMANIMNEMFLENLYLIDSKVITSILPLENIFPLLVISNISNSILFENSDIIIYNLSKS